jgi:hypothetical protein
MATEKTTYNNWDKPLFPSDNLATELDTLIDDIDADVSTVSVSDSTTEILAKSSDLNFGHDIEVFDDNDGTVSINSTAVSPDEVGVADGVAELDGNAKVLTSQLPSLVVTETDVVTDKTERLALDAEKGDIAVQENESQSYILKGSDPSVDSNWTILQSPTTDVESVFGRTGAVTAESNDYDHSQIGNISSNDHHARYTDSEAQSAVSSVSSFQSSNFEITENSSTNSLDFNYTG